MADDPTQAPDEAQDPPGNQVDQPGGDPSQPVADPEKEANDAKAMQGRLMKEQERVRKMTEYTRQYGVDFDEEGNPVQYGNPPAPTQAPPANNYTPPVDDPEEAYLNDPVGFIQKQIQAGVAAALPGIVGLIDQTQAPLLKMANQDWDDIAPAVQKNLAALGFQNITHARAVNPAAVDMAIQAARGQRMQSDDWFKTEAERRARLAQTVTGQGAPSKESSTGLTVEQQQEARNAGLSDEDYITLLSDPVQIEVMKKPEGK